MTTTTPSTATSLREPTLQPMGLGTVLDIFRNGKLPVDTATTVDRVFGPAGDRGALVITGASGIVGAGKTMQLASRLAPYGIPVVALDFPDAPDGIGQQYAGLEAAFGREGASRIMSSVIRLTYDGKTLPRELKDLKPRFLLEAIPEILEVKKAHYALFRESFPDLEIRSVTSGFPMKELGVGVAHPAFPHEINKMWEIIEEEPSDITRMLWALGLVPVPVSDDWSFVLDVLFCGVTHAALGYHHASNMPFWKIDKYVRRLIGPNPLRAHDAIGAAGADFLTWSCLHHLAEVYGEVFRPTAELDERKDTGQNWYPPNHFRPLVDWGMTEEEQETFRAWILGPLFQMTSLMLHENRAHLTHMNAIGELCAQFRHGILALAREMGQDEVVQTVEAYHRLHPEAAGSAWYPDAFANMDQPAWQQLYVNAETDGTVGVVTISRESYNSDVDAELNRALDWLKAQGVKRLILTSDFHLSTQMVGADTSEFWPALDDPTTGAKIAGGWSKTARRLAEDFEVSVAFVAGKRLLGGMLELMEHCHYLIAHDGASVGMPEVGVPVVPGMEGCHWPFRKAAKEDWPRLLGALLTGQAVKAQDAVGWWIDYAGPMADALKTAWAVASGGQHALTCRGVETGALQGVPTDVADLPEADSPATEATRKAIVECVQASCGVPLAEALDVQAKISSEFLCGPIAKKGSVGQEYAKTNRI